MKISIHNKSILPIISIFALTLFYYLKYSSGYLDIFKSILLIGNISCVIYFFIYIRFTYKKLFIYIALFLVSLYFIIKLKNNTLMTMFIFMIAFENIDLDKIIKYLLFSTSIILITLFVLGYIPHTNVLGIISSVPITLYCSYRKDKIKLIEVVILVILSYYIMLISTNKGMLFIVIPCLVLFYIARFTIVKKIFMSKIVSLSFILCFMLNFFFAICVGENKVPFIGNYISSSLQSKIIDFAHIIDTAMSSRLSLSYISLQKFGYNLIGSNIDIDNLYLDQYSYFYIDSGYNILLQGFGLLFTIMFLILLTITIRYFQKIDRVDLVICSISIALWNINEPIFNIIILNYILLFPAKAVIYYVDKNKFESRLKKYDT